MNEAAQASAGAWLVRANNPSPMTLDGTNTWVLVEPSGGQAVVIDPGPYDAAHRDAVIATVKAAGATRVALVLLTHGHPDHADGAAAFAEATGAPVRAAATECCSPGAVPLADLEQLRVGELRLDVVGTPGHTADSLCFVVGARNQLLTGDTVLGRGSSVVARPDGRLADYLASLRRLRALVDERRLDVVLPGHGPVVDDPVTLIDGYLRHRAERLAEVRAASEHAGAVDDILKPVYGDVDPGLRSAARWSLLAQLDYLRELGERVPEEEMPAG